MDSDIIIGADLAGKPVPVDIEELLATRLLVQGNSGSGKSHLLRRLLEESAGLVQQVVIDPEGDFVSLADEFSHVVIDGAAHSVAEIEALARRVREHRASVVLALEELDVEQQIRCAALFLHTLFDAPREHWFPAIVVVDEAQMFAPAVAGEISEETRRMSMGAMTNLMCRGRKRGLAGIVATQRLAKLAKNVAAEASNFLMGRTFLDIDMIRAADLLGMERRQAEQIRDLERGQFLALGPAITRRPIKVMIGGVRTGAKTSAGGLMPLPAAPQGDMSALLLSDLDEAVELASTTPPPAPEPAETIARRMEALEPTPTVPTENASAPGDDTQSASVAATGVVEDVLRQMAAEPGATFQPASSLFQTFLMHCRKRGASAATLDMAQFRKQFALAVGKLSDFDDGSRERVLALVADLEDDLVAPFMVLAHGAIGGETSADEDALANAYGTSSPSRVRRMLDHLESRGLIVTREEYGGARQVIVPGLEQVSD